MAVPEVELKPIVEKLVREFLVEFVKENELKIRELSLMERIVRVEEELKALREIQIAQFEAIEKRFEALQREMDKRFEAMEVRFEAIDKRFEVIEKRLNFMQWFIGIGFTIVSILIALFSFVGK